MPTGPFGGPRPFADGTLTFRARYVIDRGLGVRLEEEDVRKNAERLIAQKIDDDTFLHDPAVELAPAGFTLLVIVSVPGILAKGGRRTTSVNGLVGVVTEGVQEAVDTNASPARELDEPTWEIECR